MKLKEVKWNAVHFEDRGILPVDKKYYSSLEWERLLNLEVEPMANKGHYKVVNK